LSEQVPESGKRDSQHWARVLQRLDDILEMSEEEQKRFLEENCSGDPQLQSQVEALLSADRNAGDFLEPPNKDIPQVVGNYRIHERLGEGGMGEVFLATQEEPIRRSVALKLIRPGRNSSEVVRRFEAERQALALMDHPCIAKVFDAGSTEEGRPYFAMEYVDGIPITDFCDQHNLTTRERLELFVLLCEGVQHAHQKAIIHRDLKPSNILVVLQDGKPLPRIIDFGLAKAMAQPLTDASLHTVAGVFLGTPEYMSPEQVEQLADIDTRTDVYALGVVLYELLTGAMPYSRQELGTRGISGIIQMVREHNPPSPSNRVGVLGADADSIASARRTLPDRLRKRLKGDLDRITMKALEKERNQRYASAAEFAMDIQRHLRHEPVLACPPGGGYRARKFVRRNRVGVIAASAVALTMVSAVIVSVHFALREAQQRKVADQERETAEAVVEFLNEDLLSAVRPSAEEGKGKDVRMQEVLREASKRIEGASGEGGRFEDKPLVEASIRETLGMTYLALGEQAPAVPHLERALLLWRTQLGEENERTLTATRNLGILYAEQGRYDEAEPLFVRSLEVNRRIHGEEHPETLIHMNTLAVLYQRQGRFDEAEPLYIKALEIHRRTVGDENRRTLTCASNLGLLYLRQGRLEEAEPLLEQAFRTQKRVFGPEDPNTLAFTRNLAHLYTEQNRFAEAEALYLEILAIQERIWGDHPTTAESMYSLANLYARQGRSQEAQAMHEKALAIRRKTLGEKNPETIASYVSLGTLLIGQAQFERAEAMLTPAHENALATLGTHHPRTIESSQALVTLYEAWGKPQKVAEYRSGM